MSTTATRDGDSYILNGTKTYITNGFEGHIFLVYAKVDGRVTAFIVDRDCPGFSSSHHIDKLGGGGDSDLVGEIFVTTCLRVQTFERWPYPKLLLTNTPRHRVRTPR